MRLDLNTPSRRNRPAFLVHLLGILLLMLIGEPAHAQSSRFESVPRKLSSDPNFEITLPGDNLTICFQDFALCAASTCNPIPGGTVTNSAGQTFPSATCLCPILPGPALADVNAGNMNGADCTAPPNGGVWSLFWPNLRIPQQTSSGKWKTLPALPQNCPGSSDGGQIVNCFSWSCTRLGKVNGVAVAQCTCPIQPVPGDTFAIQSGQCDQSACDDFPVAAPIEVPNFCSEIPK
jgi:hypothetical protein